MSVSHPPEPLPLGDELVGAAADPMAGRVFGQRYRVVRRLGEGGMGAVYLCEHEILGRRFAVKVLRPDRAADPELKERFRNEALAASRIGQENVVDVLDFGEEADGASYYVMEALEGRSLGAVIQGEGPLPVGRTLALVEHVARALAAAHARGVIHRDVKPDNVFVVRGHDGIERAKVLDFGISHVDLGRERITRAGSIIGTPEYMAPEQALGGAVDHRADVYALGVLAFEMLTGALPLVGDSAVATLLAHQTRAPKAPSQLRAGIPAEVDALVLRALAKNPAERFESMLDLAAEVARIRLSGPLPATTTRSGGAAQTVRFDPGEAAGMRAEVPLPSAGVASRPGAAASPSRGVDEPFPAVDVHLTTPGALAPARPRRGARASVVGAGALVLALGGAAWWWASRAGPPAPPPRLEVAPARDAAATSPLAGDPASRTPAAGEPSRGDRLVSPAADARRVAPVSAAAPAERPAPVRAERVPAAARSPSPSPAPLRPEAQDGARAVKDPYAEEAGLKPDPFR
jgi:tRNA A-37 threonylcarbamoyl transferase component Bud32